MVYIRALCSHSLVNATCFDVKLKVSPQQGIPNTLGVARANENVYGIFSHLSREFMCVGVFTVSTRYPKHIICISNGLLPLSLLYNTSKKNIIATLTISSGA